MQYESAEEEKVDTATNVCERAPGSCPVGGCGTGKGMCPGIALVLGIIVGTGVSYILSRSDASPESES